MKLFYWGKKQKLSCSFNQQQIQPCLNAYLITSTFPFFNQSEGEDLVKRRHMDVSVKYWEVYESGILYSPVYLSDNRSQKKRDGAEWIEVLVVVVVVVIVTVVEKISGSPVKLLSPSTETQWNLSQFGFIDTLTSNLAGSVWSHSPTLLCSHQQTIDNAITHNVIVTVDAATHNTQRCFGGTVPILPSRLSRLCERFKKVW